MARVFRLDQGDRLVMAPPPPDFVSVIGALLPIALCGRSSLKYLRQASNFFGRIFKRKEPVRVQTFGPEPTIKRFDEGIVCLLAW